MIDLTNDSMDTPHFLANVVNEARAKIQNHTNMKTYTKNAKILEEFLNYTFFGLNNASMSNNPWYQKIAKGIHRQRYEAVLNAMSVGPMGDISPNFSELTDFGKYMNSGVRFEKTFAQTITNFLTHSTNSRYNQQSIMEMGSGATDAAGLGGEGMRDTLSEAMNQAAALNKIIEAERPKKSKEIQEAVDEINVSTKSYVSGPGKVDVAFSQTMDGVVATFHDGFLDNVKNLLLGSTWSLKAYVNGGSIHLGQSNPAVAFFSEVGSGSFAAVTRWYRSLRCMGIGKASAPKSAGLTVQAYSKNNAHEHASGDNGSRIEMYLLRFIYELTGNGQIYNQEYMTQRILEAMGVTDGYAQYLCYWNQAQNKIDVYSTAQLVSQMVDNVKDAQKWKKLKHSSNLSTVMSDTTYTLNARINLHLSYDANHELRVTLESI